MQIPAGYSATADELSARIEALIPAHPEVLTMTDPGALFQVPGFKCDDLGPTLAQAAFALRAAQQRHTSRNSGQ